MNNNINVNNEFILLRTSIALIRLLKELTSKKIETLRVARLAYFLSVSNMVIPKKLIDQISSLLIARQYSDGGWADTVETIWATSFFKTINDTVRYEKGLSYLVSSRHSNGAWGKTTRDISRIPLTGLIGLLHPEIISKNTKIWLKKEWFSEWDQKTNSIAANYKAAYVIFGLGVQDTIVKDILDWLINQIESDGGWAPWYNHPIGSQTVYTALSMKSICFCRSLLNTQAKTIWKSGEDFLKNSVKPYGLWPCHHIDEGSAWAFNVLQESLMNKLMD